MIFIIADDLTGASDAGVKYKKNGFRTMVETEYSGTDQRFGLWGDQFDVVSINANTRLLSPQAAYRKIFELARQVGRLHPEYIYKKMDSLLRGNPVVELDAVMDATDAEVALVVPSFPENGRKLVGGLLKATGETAIDVLKIFRENSKRKVRGIMLEEIGRGPEHLRQDLERGRSEGAAIFLLDAASDRDLEIIRDAAKSLSGKLVFCGSAGFAKHLSNEEKRSGISDHHTGENKPLLVAAGSRRKETARQLERVSQVCRTPIITMDVAGLMRDGPARLSEIERSRDRILEYTREGYRLILFAVSSLFPENQKNAAVPGEDGIDAVDIAKAIGETVQEVYRQIGFRAVISTGGDTSLQICRALGAEGIELYDEITSGIPIGRIVGGTADGMAVVTKSGGFGDGDALIRIVDYLEKFDGSSGKGVVDSK